MSPQVFSGMRRTKVPDIGVPAKVTAISEGPLKRGGKFYVVDNHLSGGGGKQSCCIECGKVRGIKCQHVAEPKAIKSLVSNICNRKLKRTAKCHPSIH